ncbi:putative IS66 family transposase [Paenibacillus sp. 598K]|nr:transposase domain-containing protein [Paenibacillus sp. 598K]GBF77349.1 putative IS66 family transposase [Paenibacillus sp. 598K]
MIETDKENGLHPYAYLKHLFEQLPQLDGPLDAKTLEPFLGRLHCQRRAD